MKKVIATVALLTGLAAVDADAQTVKKDNAAKGDTAKVEVQAADTAATDKGKKKTRGGKLLKGAGDFFKDKGENLKKEFETIKGKVVPPKDTTNVPAAAPDSTNNTVAPVAPAGKDKTKPKGNEPKTPILDNLKKIKIKDPFKKD